MLVRDCMTTNVFTVGFDKKLLIVSELMDWARVRHVPVVDRDRRLVGIISHRDLLRASISSTADFAEIERREHLGMIPIESVMQREVRTIDPEATVQAAARVMVRNKLGCLPVVFHGRLIGIVTEHDLLEVLSSLEHVTQ